MNNITDNCNGKCLYVERYGFCKECNNVIVLSHFKPLKSICKCFPVQCSCCTHEFPTLINSKCEKCQTCEGFCHKTTIIQNNQ